MRPRLLVLFFFLSASSAEQRRVKSDEERCQEEHPTLLYYFSWADYTVLAMMLLVTCLIGTFYGFFSKKQENNQDFLLGGSSMGTFPTAMSLTASFITAIELLGNPAEMYGQVRQFNYLIDHNILHIRGFITAGVESNAVCCMKRYYTLDFDSQVISVPSSL